MRFRVAKPDMAGIVLDPIVNGHAYCLMQAAIREGVDFDVVRGDDPPSSFPHMPWLRLFIGGESFYAKRQMIMRQAVAGGPLVEVGGSDLHKLVTDKQRVKHLLVEAGITVPAGRVFHREQLDAAFFYAAELPGELCVKPNRGRLGDLVFPGLRTAESIAEALLAVGACYDEILVEQSRAGGVWRFTQVDGEIVAIKLSRPASVVGDGRSTIDALIDARKVERTQRAQGHHSDCPDGHATDFMLARQGLRRTDIPASGLRVFIHPASNMSMGADSVCMPGLPHDSYIPLMKRAFAAIPGLIMGSADVAILDATVPATPDNYAVLEINGRPGLKGHHFPWEGPAQDVATPILRLLKRLTGTGQ